MERKLKQILKYINHQPFIKRLGLFKVKVDNECFSEYESLFYQISYHEICVIKEEIIYPFESFLAL